jgi:hypothetical protein
MGLGNGDMHVQDNQGSHHSSVHRPLAGRILLHPALPAAPALPGWHMLQLPASWGSGPSHPTMHFKRLAPWAWGGYGPSMYVLPSTGHASCPPHLPTWVTRS